MLCGDLFDWSTAGVEDFTDDEDDDDMVGMDDDDYMDHVRSVRCCLTAVWL